ncbi:MAG: 8-amino-7-oxononanoate synthase [Gammaproteobacteria bacterium]
MGVSPLDRRLRAELARLRAEDLHRVRRVVRGRHGVQIEVDGRRCVNFCSNDYLGLAADPRVAEAAASALRECGTGSGAAALISGYNLQHRALEEALAEFTRRPRALLFSSGWAANLGALRALLDKSATLVADELNHASLIDGGRLSGARYQRVAHRDLAGFAQALSGARGAPAVVATDGVFSMDGDLAPLAELAALCRREGAALMVDDAHGFGVLGEGGRGALFAGPAPLGVDEVPVYMATLGKTLGVSGAFIAGSEALVDYLVQRARAWVFSTAPPPALAAAALESLRIVRTEPERRERLFEAIARLRAGAAQLGIALGESATPIQPLVLGDERRVLAVSAALLQRGFWVAAIRPPTVPRGTARLRITLSAAHDPAQVDALLEALAGALRETAGRETAAA